MSILISCLLALAGSYLQITDCCNISWIILYFFTCCKCYFTSEYSSKVKSNNLLTINKDYNQKLILYY